MTVFFNNSPLQEFSIAELNVSSEEITFVIPSYQRGYRWATTNDRSNKEKNEKGEIETLLDDLKEFVDNGEWKRYCLQPIILQKIEGKESFYRVVDGQQRLTTIAIICHALGVSKKWDLYYSAEKKKLSECLKSYDVTQADSPKDIFINDFFRRNALTAIKRWLDDKENANVVKKIKSLLNDSSNDHQISVIKYILTEDDAKRQENKKEEPGHAAFKRLNSAKIPLTSGELIKALFMASQSDLEKSDKMEIAKEWELIEQTLKDDKYWNMFNVQGTGLQETQTRIELLFSIVGKLTPEELGNARYDSRLIFLKIEKMIHDKKKSLEEIWDEVLKVFWWIQSCYKNIKIYNLLGWLALFRRNMPNTIYEMWHTGAKQDWETFIQKLKEQTCFRERINKVFDLKINDDSEIKEKLDDKSDKSEELD